MTGEYEGKQGNHNNLKQLEGFWDSHTAQLMTHQDEKDGATGTTIDKTKYQEREKAFFTELNMTGDDLGTTLPAR